MRFRYNRLVVAFAGVLALAVSAWAEGAALAVPRVAEPFPMTDVRLLDGPFREAMLRDQKYLLALEPDRLLHTFRVNVGLPSQAKPLGGWEEPTCELRGHSLGHYLSALSLMYASTGDAEYKRRVDYIVGELAKCQSNSPRAGFHEGYLAAFPESFIDRVEQSRPVWAPWYTLHKIMAGLLDANRLCGDEQALTVLEKMADWVGFRVEHLSPAQMQKSLDNEHGGMNEVLANLYAVTGNTNYLQLSAAFNHAKVLDPLAQGEDRLNGIHANTQIPKIIGVTREYELTGDPQFLKMAHTFWDAVALRRSYVIGGDSDHEHFFSTQDFAKHLSSDTCETCNTYNMLKLTRELFALEPDAVKMDFYERALYNHILASQDPETGMFVYLMSLKPGHFKTYSTPEDSFWCCVGTGMENHGKYGDTIYFHDADSLYVNLFIASELMWKEKGLVVRQETQFPESDSTILKISAAQPVNLALKVRHPAWAVKGLMVSVNGDKQSVHSTPGSYFTLQREWRDGDKVEIQFPMTLHTEPLPGVSNTVAVLYGPIVLAGEMGTNGMPNPITRHQTDYSKLPAPSAPVFVTEPGEMLKQIEPVAGQPLMFRTHGLGQPRDVTLIPFYRMHRERYSVYWEVVSPQDWKASQSAAATDTEKTVLAPLVKLQPVPFTAVKISDAFWSARQETNRIASIPVSLDNLEKAGNLENFRLAARHATNGFRGPVFMDSDLYKAIEAASFSLATHPDPELEARLDVMILLIAAAQQPDGYLDTYYIVKEPGRRWTNLRDCHELYCAGHLIEAAVAHYQATGKTNLLTVATKLADHIDSVFGPEPKRLGYPGHPEIELALVKLWRATGEPRYFALAKFFVENRGRHFFAQEHQLAEENYDGTYWLDDVPIFDHEKIKGHAVRAAYLMSGTTDVAAQTGDPRLLAMLERVWGNTTEKNMYLTGGIGPSARNEGFTVDYDLPNLTAYQETCATVALAQWASRMGRLYGDAKYADVVERGLYNGMLAGVSHDGNRFFYVNPLESTGNHHRQEWFGCACCPPNAARTIASLGGYAYATGSNSLWVNLYIQGEVEAQIGDRKITVAVKTDYPWDGRVVLKPQVKAAADFELRLRVPGWCQGASLSLNGKMIATPKMERGYFVLSRQWEKGEVVTLDLPMPVQRVAANPMVAADQGLLAIQRGPLVYCVEPCDQTAPVASLVLPAAADLNVEKSKLFDGITVIRGLGEETRKSVWNDTLYQNADAPKRIEIKAVPYFVWDNRQAGPMKVWLPDAPAARKTGGLEARAAVKMSFANGNCEPGAINDGVEPVKSSDQPETLAHWWPHKGTEEWAQYTWPSPVRVRGSKVFWFDDTGRGECRLPAAWHIDYLAGSEWKPVAANGGYPVAKDKWCEVKFSPVRTTALRLVVQLPEGWSAGVHEWKITE